MTDNRTLPERFWPKVKVSASDGCWPWQGCLSADGYGRFSVCGKNKNAHRVMWVMAFGEIPDGLCVCHTCDNRRCVNPLHLFLGTNAENTADKVAKGRQCLGEKNGRSKLTGPEVLRMRERWDVGDVTQTDLAKEYGVGRTVIGAVIRRERWVHV